MRKKVFCKVLSLCLATIMLVGIIPAGAYVNVEGAGAARGASEAISARPDDPTRVPKALADIDWNSRLTYSEIEKALANMAEQYPNITELYEIGRSWQERSLWCLEITNERVPDSRKVGIGVFGNIHGGERESGTAALYTAWWFVTNSDNEYVKNILDHYIIYVNPVINPDGYEQSFVINNRPNLRPTDANGDGIPFSDPYTDIDGDGYIATLYRGKADDTPSTSMSRFGMESPDWDKNGKLGDDPRTSGIDMNRTFDYEWGYYNIETDPRYNGDEDSKVIGANSWSSNGGAKGLGPASEPEIKALQNFMYEHPMNALTTLHTGIQCVLFPWCSREVDETNAAEKVQLDFMRKTAEAMAGQWTETTGRGSYFSNSYYDYPTTSEMIDYAFGRFNIHAYTIEVYQAGGAGKSDVDDCSWGNPMPENKWVFYSQDDLRKMGLDPAALTDANGEGLKSDEGLWFYTTATNQMVDKAPEDQITMCKGTRDAILVMIESERETVGGGYTLPTWTR
ncbi:MAG: hypothetical protein HFF42_11160 [Lawsonibacter sp.]|jgi:hypothetical protein|nr:hypothetical protein [Lawsonibacter sp.]